MRGDHLQPFDDFKPGRVGRHQKTGQAFGPRPFAGPRKNSVDIGNATIRDPGFFTINDPAIAVSAGTCRHIGHVRSACRFRQGKAGDGRPGCCLVQPGPVPVIAKQADGPHAKPLHGKGKIGQSVMPGQGFTDQAQAAHIERWLCLIGTMVKPATVTKHTDKLAAGRINIVVIYGQMRIAPAFKRCRQFAVRVIQKGPIKKTAVRHQFPSKTGFSLVINAL